MRALGALAALGAVAGCDGSQADWQAAAAEDTQAAYQSFLDAHPGGAHADEAGARIAQLQAEEAAAWEAAAAAGTLDAFDAFVASHPSSGRRRAFGAFPPEVRKAIEDRIVESIAAGDLEGRFVLENVEVNADSSGGRFNIAVQSGDGGAELYLFSTVYPDDWIPVAMQLGGGGGGMVLKVDGDMMLAGLQSVQVADGTVWRISGTTSQLLPEAFTVPGRYVIEGDEADPLTFYLKADVGAVYAHGRGEILSPDGEVVFAAD